MTSGAWDTQEIGAVTMPPRPGVDEAYQVAGKWEAAV
jgi:hypothetical protein